MMSDFLNNNSNSIFALLMLIVSLLIPTISERVKIKYQSKIDNTKRDKATYECLMNYMFDFHKASLTLMTSILNQDDDAFYMLKYDNQSMNYDQLIEKHLKSNYDLIFSLYIKTLNMDRSVLLSLYPIVQIAPKIIDLLKQYKTIDKQEMRTLYGSLISSYQAQMLQIRVKIKKIIQ